MFNNNVGNHASCYIFSLKISFLQFEFLLLILLLLMFIVVTSGLQYTCCIFRYHKSVSSVNQVSLTLCGPMDCKMPGFPVHHQLLELSQTHIDWVGEAIQPFHPVVHFLYCLQPMRAWGSFPMSQHFTRGGQSIGVSASASVLPMNVQGWSPLGWTGWISFLSKGFSRVFSSTTIQKHQFFGAQLSL